jgi:DNA-binding beta-propeller fold protein YncE
LKRGKLTIFASTGLNHPTDLAFDSAGYLYVVNNGNNTIARFSPDGSTSVFANTGLNGPVGITIVPEPSLGHLTTASRLLLLGLSRKRKPRGGNAAAADVLSAAKSQSR